MNSPHEQTVKNIQKITQALGESLSKIYEKNFPNNPLNEKDCNHKLAHGIGQPYKVIMLNLFFARAANLPEEHIDLLHDFAEKSLKLGYQIAAIDNPHAEMAQNIKNILKLKRRWKRRIDKRLNAAGIIGSNNIKLNTEEEKKSLRSIFNQLDGIIKQIEQTPELYWGHLLPLLPNTKIAENHI